MTPDKVRVDYEIDRAIGEHRIVGTDVIVVSDGQVAYSRAAGYADRESERLVRKDAIFRLASIGKPIVSAAALALVEQGRLNLDGPVRTWLPGFQPKTGGGDTPVITIRHLLTHTAGLSYGFLEPADGPYHRAGVSDGLDQPGWGLDEELRRIASAGLTYQPGSRWGYSIAIDVLGALIAEVAGESLPDAVRHLVTDPLGMPDTGFGVTDLARLATPYADDKPEPVRMADPQHVPVAGLAGISFSPSRALDAGAFPSGGSGMIGTAGDVARFLEALRTGGGPILKPLTVREMMTNQIGNLVTNRPGWGFGYGGAVLVDPVAAKTPQSPGTWGWGGRLWPQLLRRPDTETYGRRVYQHCRGGDVRSVHERPSRCRLCAGAVLSGCAETASTVMSSTTEDGSLTGEHLRNETRRPPRGLRSNRSMPSHKPRSFRCAGCY